MTRIKMIRKCLDCQHCAITNPDSESNPCVHPNWGVAALGECRELTIENLTVKPPEWCPLIKLGAFSKQLIEEFLKRSIGDYKEKEILGAHERRNENEI